MEKTKFENLVESIVHGYETTTVTDINNIRIMTHHPDKEKMFMEGDKYQEYLVDKYNERYKDLSSDDVLRMCLADISDILDNMKLDGDIYDTAKLPERTPEELELMIKRLIEVAFLQKMMIQHNIILLVDDIIKNDKDFYLKFVKENEEKIPVYDIAWNIYVVGLCVVPYRQSKYFKIDSNVRLMMNMNEFGKMYPKVFVDLAKYTGIITDKEAEILYNYISANTEPIKFN